MSVFLLLCGFNFLDMGKVKVTAEEMDADKAMLDSCRMSSKYFYAHDFLYPKIRNYIVNVTVTDYDSLIAMSCYPSQRDMEQLGLNIRKFNGEQAYNEFQQAKNRDEKLRIFVESKLTPERREFIRQMRFLTSKFCKISPSRHIVIGISLQDALDYGISEQAYNNVNEWIESINEHVEYNLSKYESITSCYYRIYFDDNRIDSEKDIFIGM